MIRGEKAKEKEEFAFNNVTAQLSSRLTDSGDTVSKCVSRLWLCWFSAQDGIEIVFIQSDICAFYSTTAYCRPSQEAQDFILVTFSITDLQLPTVTIKGRMPETASEG